MEDRIRALEEKVDELERVVLHLCERILFSDKPLTLKQYLWGWDIEREIILHDMETLRADNQVVIAKEKGSHPLLFRGDPKFQVDCEDAQSEYFYWEKDDDSDDHV